MKKVFLGGTCGQSTWREELIPTLKCDYYNPVVPDWNEEVQKREIFERENADFVLYVITKDMKGIYSIAEVVDDSNKRPEKTIFCNLFATEDPHMAKSLKALENMLKNNGAIVCSDLREVADYLNQHAIEIEKGKLSLEEIQNMTKLEKEMELCDAAINGRIGDVKLLLQNGVDVHSFGDQALNWAAKKGHIDVVQVLLDNGADVHARDDGSLKKAALNGNIEITKLLLDAGADIHSGQDRALLLAANSGEIETVKLLLEYGADVHAQDDRSLYRAVLNGHTEVVELLIENGADIHAQNDKALRTAIQNGHNDIVELLEKHEEKTSSLFKEVMAGKHTAMETLEQEQEPSIDMGEPEI